MLPYDLAEQATLFECIDPLDEQFCGQPVGHGPLRDMIVLANTWHDVRLCGARIVTASDVELRARDIECVLHAGLIAD